MNTKKNSQQKRNFMCTINFKESQDKDPLLFLPDFTQLNWLQRVSFQLERGDKSNLLHWQVFLENKYPVPILKMGADFKALGCKITICEPTSQSHRMAGRNYVRKGKDIDGHRYIWDRKTGWENNKFPIVPEEKHDVFFELDSRANVIKAIKRNIELCSNYVSKCSTRNFPQKTSI